MRTTAKNRIDFTKQGKTIVRALLPRIIQAGGEPRATSIVLQLEEHVHDEQCRKQCNRIGLTLGGAHDQEQDRALYAATMPRYFPAAAAADATVAAVVD